MTPSSYDKARGFYLAKVSEAEQEVVVGLQRRQAVLVVVNVSRLFPARHSSDAEVELRVPHYTRVGVREGEVADVGLILLT